MKILLASPRGFCAGVERAIDIVERALEKFGPPIYVRHEIVHNKAVVSKLRDKGAVFVEQLGGVPDGGVVVFSAHGVPARVVGEAEARGLVSVDATCPLVKKVHAAVQRHDTRRVQVLLIGHHGHPEVEGTMGQLARGKVKLVGSVEDAWTVDVDDPENLAYTTQTTLSIDETREVIRALQERFPSIKGPDQGDLCYATTNRQMAVRKMMPMVDMLLVIGSKNSSNSNRLREYGEGAGKPSYLIDGVRDLREEWFAEAGSVGVSSGASAPEYLVQEVVKWLVQRFPESEVEDYVLLEENVHFPLPGQLRQLAR